MNYDLMLSRQTLEVFFYLSAMKWKKNRNNENRDDESRPDVYQPNIWVSV